MKIDTPERLLGALTTLEDNLPTYQAEVEATAAEITAVSQDRANLAQSIANGELYEQRKITSTAIKNSVYDGDPSEKIAEYPSSAVDPLPFPEVRQGAKTRYRDLKARYKTADGYTLEIGIALGFEDAPSEAPSLDSLQASAKVRDLGGYQYEGDFLKKGMTGVLFQHRIKGTEKWIDAKTAFGSPVIINVEPPAIEGAAVQIEIRCRLLKGNNLVGQWSPIYPLTVTA